MRGRAVRRLVGIGCLSIEVALAARATRIGLRNGVPGWSALDQAWVGISVVSGLTAVGCGVVLLHRRPRAWFGPCAIAVGLSFTIWLACNLSGSAVAGVAAAPLTTVFRVLLGALVLAWPIGRMSRADRIGLTVYAGSLSLATATYHLVAPDLFNGTPSPVNILSLPTLAQVVNQFLVVTLVPVWGAVLVVVVVRRSRRLPAAARALARPAVLAALVAGGSDVTLFASDRLFGDVAAVVSVGRWVDVARFGVVPLVFALAARRLVLTRERVRTIDVGQRQPVGLQQSLARGLGDPTVRLGFRRPDDSWVGSSGEAITLGGHGRSVTTIEHDDVAVAAIDHDVALDDRPSVVEAALATTALSLEHTRLEALALARLADVQRARLAIVTAEDVARHRLERDLHDGAQQRLVGLALQSRLVAAARAPVDGELALLARGVDDARKELRSIATGSLPAILAERGLAPALEVLATTAPIGVTLRVNVPAEVPAPVATTAWFVVSEAVANAVKHAGAQELTVRIDASDGGLHAEVVDDGSGGADAAAGGGLAGLHRRVAALGGTLTVTSPKHGGTTVRVVLPFGGGE